MHVAHALNTCRLLPKQNLPKQHTQEGCNGSTLLVVKEFPQEPLIKACDLECLGGDFDKGNFGNDLQEERELLAIIVMSMREPSVDLIALQSKAFLLHPFSFFLFLFAF